MRAKIQVLAKENDTKLIGEFWYQGSSNARAVSAEIVKRFTVEPGAVFRSITQQGKRVSCDLLVDVGQ